MLYFVFLFHLSYLCVQKPYIGKIPFGFAMCVSELTVPMKAQGQHDSSDKLTNPQIYLTINTTIPRL